MSMQTHTISLENVLACSDKDEDTYILWASSSTLGYILKKLMYTFTPIHDKFLIVSILVFLLYALTYFFHLSLQATMVSPQLPFSSNQLLKWAVGKSR